MDCVTGKLVYQTRQEAKAVLSTTRYRTNRTCVIEYKCEQCGHWHVSSQNQEKRTKKNKNSKFNLKEKRIEKYKPYKNAVLEKANSKKTTPNGKKIKKKK